jgi:hypothetical protein
LSSSGIWRLLPESDAKLDITDILCATDGPAPAIFLPSPGPHSRPLPDRFADAVDTAFSRHAIAAEAPQLPEKSKPVVSAMQVFGSPLRASQTHVRFADKKPHK